MILGNTLDFDQIPTKGLVLEQAATAALDAALTALGQLGYDTTKQRAKLFDGTTVRQLLQDNDVSTDTLSNAVSGGALLVSATQIKAYIDALATSGQQPFTDFDASAASQFPTGATLSSRYRVSAAGTVLGVILGVGDTILPKAASPSATTASDWIFVQGNVDAATGSIFGLVLLATLAEIQANAGGNANKVITVATLNSWEAALGRVKSFTTTVNIAVGANAITHNLGADVAVVSWDANDTIHYKVQRTSATVVTLTAAKSRNSVKVKCFF